MQCVVGLSDQSVSLSQHPRVEHVGAHSLAELLGYQTRSSITVSVQCVFENEPEHGPRVGRQSLLERGKDLAGFSVFSLGQQRLGITGSEIRHLGIQGQRLSEQALRPVEASAEQMTQPGDELCKGVEGIALDQDVRSAGCSDGRAPRAFASSTNRCLARPSRVRSGGSTLRATSRRACDRARDRPPPSRQRQFRRRFRTGPLDRRRARSSGQKALQILKSSIIDARIPPAPIRLTIS